ncbi:MULTISPECIES: FecR family protein [unclassified Sphingobacterium]|uniref:FecR family protein n=1 Tax=unclassified Sphingobacterium TaxID=2609468 RepID=UPI0015FFBA39|nr:MULTISPECIES: FecR family protein [unclassified Sphingobacterium]MBB1646761.1 hypothetical protein [Sphingobacterium sp. UME9]WET67079.1 MAG: FecR domain-containing protein [Sphingobacterium sp.]
MDKNGEQLYFAGLLAKTVQGLASDEEIMALKNFMADNPQAAQLLVDLDDTELLDQELDELQKIDLAVRWDSLEERRKSNSIPLKRISPFYIWLSATAAVLIIVLSLLWKRTVVSNTSVIPDHQYGYKNDVTPGHDGATLTLADGRVVDLGKAINSSAVDTANIQIFDSFVEFKDQTNSADYRPNRIHTPKGGTFQAVLADGTKIWLNSNSEIEFPSQFSANERRMKLISGEAFFEVAKNIEKPFIVETQSYAIHVTGTAFNINNYQDQTVKTLLTEGKVKVVGKQMSASLLPGQAVINTGEALRTETADVNEALSWREGYFYFDGKTLPQILVELSRWYDVDVKYQITVDQTTYMGGAKRSNTLATVCKMLTDMSRYTFEINGKELVVKNNKGGK